MKMNKIAQAAVELFKQPLETTGYKYVVCVPKLPIHAGYYFMAGHIEADKNGLFFRRAGTMYKSVANLDTFFSFPQGICLVIRKYTIMCAPEIASCLFGHEYSESDLRYVKKTLKDLFLLGIVRKERWLEDARMFLYKLTPEMDDVQINSIYPPICKNDKE